MNLFSPCNELMALIMVSVPTFRLQGKRRWGGGGIGCLVQGRRGYLSFMAGIAGPFLPHVG